MPLKVSHASLVVYTSEKKKYHDGYLTPCGEGSRYVVQCAEQANYSMPLRAVSTG